MTTSSTRFAANPSNIPPRWDDVTAEWMSSALQKTFPASKSATSSCCCATTARTNRRARFGLSYASGRGPATVFLKASDPAHAALNARTGGVLNEPRLFSSGVPLHLDHPEVYFTVIDEPHLTFMLVMEDITARGCDPRDSLRPMTVEQVVNGVRSLAKLHSAYWSDRLHGEQALSWVEPFVAWRGVMARGIDIGIRRAGGSIPPEVRNMTGAQIEDDLWIPYIGTLSKGPQTLLHGDPHIGNTYVLPDSGVGFLDWQVVRRGNFSVDLGYFVQGALTIEDRRVGEVECISEYRDALDLPAGELPTEEEIWHRYRASAVHGLTMRLVTAASDTWQRPEVSLVLAQRYAAAYVELNASEAR
jgi:hypothetical protein